MNFPSPLVESVFLICFKWEKHRRDSSHLRWGCSGTSSINLAAWCHYHPLSPPPKDLMVYLWDGLCHHLWWVFDSFSSWSLWLEKETILLILKKKLVWRRRSAPSHRNRCSEPVSWVLFSNHHIVELLRFLVHVSRGRAGVSGPILQSDSFQNSNKKLTVLEFSRKEQPRLQWKVVRYRVQSLNPLLRKFRVWVWWNICIFICSFT